MISDVLLILTLILMNSTLLTQSEMRRTTVIFQKICPDVFFCLLKQVAKLLTFYNSITTRWRRRMEEAKLSLVYPINAAPLNGGAE